MSLRTLSSSTSATRKKSRAAARVNRWFGFVAQQPASPWPHARLASAYALSGDLDRAAAELAEARRLRGEGSFSSIAKMKAGGSWGSLSPKVRDLFEATYFAGLRKAGMPEE